MQQNNIQKNSNISNTILTTMQNTWTTLWLQTQKQLKQNHQENKFKKTIKKQKQKSQSSSQSQDKIIINKKQFLQFIKKFAIKKISYQQQLDLLKTNYQSKVTQISSLETQINNLKTQQQYFLKIIQQLRDKHQSQLQSRQNEYKSNLTCKQNQLQKLHQTINILTTYLTKSHKSNQFNKSKQQYIDNIDQQIAKYHQYSAKIQQPLENNGSYTSKNRQKSNKKIILKRTKNQQKFINNLLLSGNINSKQQLINYLNQENQSNLHKSTQNLQALSKCRSTTIDYGYLRKPVQYQPDDQSHTLLSIRNLDYITQKTPEDQYSDENFMTKKSLSLEKNQKQSKILKNVKSTHILSSSNLSQLYNRNK